MVLSVRVKQNKTHTPNKVLRPMLGRPVGRTGQSLSAHLHGTRTRTNGTTHIPFESYKCLADDGKDAPCAWTIIIYIIPIKKPLESCVKLLASMAPIVYYHVLVHETLVEKKVGSSSLE